MFDKAALNVIFAVGSGGSGSKNNTPNKASPPKVGSPKKSEEKGMSQFQAMLV
jgi:hypothetical protein